jgi:hypothetical protein
MAVIVGGLAFGDQRVDPDRWVQNGEQGLYVARVVGVEHPAHELVHS